MITDQDKFNRIKTIKDMFSNNEVTDPEDERCYLIQLENLLPKPTKTLYIDADSLIFYTAYSPTNTSTVKEIEGSFIGESVDTLDDLKAAFHSIIKEVVESCRKNSLLGNMTRFKDYKLIFTPSTNFRYNLYPDYKANRKDRERSEDEIKLKKYAHSIGLIVEGVEADDVVAYYGRHGHPIASGDKDVIYGVPGRNYYYHSKHQKVVKTSKEDSERFILMQTLAGDSTDGIPGLKGVGMKNKLLDNIPNPTFEDIIKIYEDKGYTKEDAILTRRLVGMDQYKGFRRGLKLFNHK